MAEYSRRIVDDVIDDLFSEFAALSLEGARGTAKTSTGRQRSKTILDLDPRRCGRSSKRTLII